MLRDHLIGCGIWVCGVVSWTGRRCVVLSRRRYSDCETTECVEAAGPGPRAERRATRCDAARTVH
eukprot:6462385-Prymnesium_polylepis.2